jgi:S1-C subfamily serine protease
MVLISALVSGAVAGGVTLAVLHSQSRTNPQTVDLGSHVTLSEDSAAVQVAGKALPAVVSVLAHDSAAPGAFGSGFLVTSDGYVVTNTAVIANSAALAVFVQGDARRHDARVVDFDCQTGLAMLKIDGVSGLPTLAFADSSGAKVGQAVVALGGPLGDHNAVKGVLSGVRRAATVADPVDASREQRFSNTMRMDGYMDPALSGGPLLDIGGRVIGLQLSSTLRSAPVALALSSNDLQPDVEQVAQTGQISVPALNMDSVDLDDAAAALMGLRPGTLVRSVQPGGAAERSGLKEGDLITQVDDLKLDAGHPLGQVLRARYKAGQRVALTVLRNGSASQLQATLAAEHPVCA